MFRCCPSVWCLTGDLRGSFGMTGELWECWEVSWSGYRSPCCRFAIDGGRKRIFQHSMNTGVLIRHQVQPCRNLMDENKKPVTSLQQDQDERPSGSLLPGLRLAHPAHLDGWAPLEGVCADCNSYVCPLVSSPLPVQHCDAPSSARKEIRRRREERGAGGGASLRWQKTWHGEGRLGAWAEATFAVFIEPLRIGRSRRKMTAAVSRKLSESRARARRIW